MYSYMFSRQKKVSLLFFFLEKHGELCNVDSVSIKAHLKGIEYEIF